MSAVIQVCGVHKPSGEPEHVATIIRTETDNPPAKKAQFLTEHGEPLQVAVSHYGNGFSCKRHYHPARQRPGFNGPTQEVWLILSGSMEVSFWDTTDQFAGSYLLGKGDLVIVRLGSHSLIATSDASMVEVKQGPYDPAADKVYL